MLTYTKETFLTINKIILSSLDIRDVYQVLSKELLKVVDFDRMTVTLVAENNDLYEAFVSTKGYSYTESKEGVFYPIKGSLTERVVQTCKPVIVEDTSEGRYTMDTSLFKEGIHSRLGFPLVYRGSIMKHQKPFQQFEKKLQGTYTERVVGSLNLESRRREYYSKKYVAFFSQVVPQLSMAIENTLFFDKLRDAEARYRKIIENSPDIIFECTKEGKFFIMNPSVEKITGYPAQYFYDRQGYGLSLCHEDDQGMVLSEISRVLDGTKSCLRNFVFRVIHKQGKIVWLSLDVLPVFQDGKITGMEGFCRDITEGKKVDELKDNLIRDVTHELKTPVAKMEMAIDMFKRSMSAGSDGLPGKGARLQDILQNNVIRLKNIIKHVLDMSKLESGAEPLKISGFSFEDLVKKVVDDLQIPSAEKMNAIRTKIPVDIPFIHADRDQMYRVVFNLLENAIKFTDKGEITISARIVRKTLEVVVRDTGRGLEKETKARVFEKFYKEMPSMPGAGIGLAICKNILRLHKGKIWVESDGKGKGSRFVFSIPLTADPRE
ncbi:MAG: ATP-binding protein [Candidatus Brocadiaceae bacterium]|nr:ATP-binding protein [Candidatus Brocadiaceae bacterium]